MNVGFSRNSLPRRKDVYHSSQWKKKIVKRHIAFYYLLIEMQLYALTFFGIEYIPQEVLNKIRDK